MSDDEKWLEGHGFSCAEGVWRGTMNGIDVETYRSEDGWAAVLDDGGRRYAASWQKTAQSAVDAGLEIMRIEAELKEKNEKVAQNGNDRHKSTYERTDEMAEGVRLP